jgi:uncharacterized protein (DUF885 family)
MDFQKLLPLLILFFGFSCSPSNETMDSASTPDLVKIAADYHEERFQFYPLEATFSGDARYNDQLPNDISEEYRTKLQAFYTKYLDQLRDLDYNSLNENDKITHDALKWECDINTELLNFKSHYLPVNQFWAKHLDIGQLASGSGAQPFGNKKDYDNWLHRVDAFIVWMNQAIENMKIGATEGYVLPTSLTTKIINQMRDLDHGPFEDHLFYMPANAIPESITEQERKNIQDDYENMVINKIIPVFKKMRDYLESEYLPQSRSTSGISAIPDANKYYQTLIRQYTTTNMTADEVFELGKQEVERLQIEMEKVKQQVGYSGDLKSFFDYVRNKKELMPYTDPQQVIDHFNAIHEKMKPHLTNLFDKVPKTRFEVRRTEAFREASGSAEYLQGSKDGSRPGIFYVPIPDVTKYNNYADEDLFLHEAIPGHHYQFSLQQENESLPEFRRTLWYSAYGEGWALYCESLGKELGLYDDPYQYFGMLSAEMHRAIRLVVDVGVHTKSWTREEAIQYSLDHEAEPEASIIAEIERYMAIPGQALSYKIGQLKIMELRKRASEKLGDQFDIKTFHNKVLESGCLPLAILELKIENWISSELLPE